MSVIPLFKTKETRVIEEHSTNDRSLVAFYNGDLEQYMILLFHVSDQPTEASRVSPYSTWGYVTAGIDGIHDEEELKKLVNMYLMDIISENTWWENEEK